jgi:hypothetical protein
VSPRLNVVVSGLIGQYPVGGVTWDYIQYLLGLIDAGHDVLYVEDSEQWPYDPSQRGHGRDASVNACYLERVMSRFGLADRWAYRFPGGALPTGEVFQERWYGIPDFERRRLLERADLLINVSSGIGNPERYRHIPCLAYVDTDPVFTQIRSTQDEHFRAHLDAHDVHFSYGECPSDAVPATGHVWLPMRKPIAVDQWHADVPYRDALTTVMNWTSYDDVVWNGQSYGQKDAEFLRFLGLPTLVEPTVLEMAVGGGITRRLPRDLLQRNGWRLVDPMQCCGDVDGYRSYIQSSKGEWTVAKNGYVRGQAGWFSGRTACYLAAGRPVVVQDTGFASVLPTGEGILIFRTLEEAADGIKEVERNWAHHARAARAIADEYFRASTVVGRLVERCAARMGANELDSA